VSWKPIETAPKDGGKVDLWAKLWNPKTDDFYRCRFTDCYWSPVDHEWRGVPQEFRPTHWMPLPDPPKDVA
jgi:hypothetical protein